MGFVAEDGVLAVASGCDSLAPPTAGGLRVFAAAFAAFVFGDGDAVDGDAGAAAAEAGRAWLLLGV